MKNVLEIIQFCLEFIKFRLDIVQSILNCLFWITTGTVTVLAYLRAKKTVLQPLKTEVFKEQIKVLSKVLIFFNSKTEQDLQRDIGFNKMFAVNCYITLERYADLFFYEGNYDFNNPLGTNNKYVKEYLSEREIPIKHTEVVNDYKSYLSMKEITKEKYWINHIVPDIHPKGILQVEYIKWKDSLRILKSSPLLPLKIIELIKEYEESVEMNMEILGNQIIEEAKRMPKKYPNLLAIETSSPPLFFGVDIKMEKLSPKADKINNQIREEFHTDKLFDD